MRLVRTGRFLIRTICAAVFVVLFCVTGLEIHLLLEERRENMHPGCVGLSCWDDSDCGPRCRCSLEPNVKLGKCVKR
jgi:hypothetical protein